MPDVDLQHDVSARQVAVMDELPAYLRPIIQATNNVPLAMILYDDGVRTFDEAEAAIAERGRQQQETDEQQRWYRFQIDRYLKRRRDGSARSQAQRAARA